jgi:hypothetical protein
MFTMKFLYLCHAAQFDERPASRFFWRHPGAHGVFDVRGQMAFQLFGEFALAPRALEQTAEPHYPAS